MADDKKPYISKSYLITQFKNFKKYIDGIFLPRINPSVTGNLTVDGDIVDKEGNSKLDFQTFDNKDVLDGFSENSEGGLIWNGAPIEGGGGGASDAIDVAYDNATSELAAENVQEAIDELDKYVDDNKLDYRVEERTLIVGGGLGQKHTYSTEEQVVGTWIDGKPLYEKTIISKLPSQINTAVNIYNFEGYNIDEFFILNSFAKNNATTTLMGNGYINWFRRNNPTGNYRLACSTDNTAYVNADLIVTVRYTKTTD